MLSLSRRAGGFPGPPLPLTLIFCVGLPLRCFGEAAGDQRSFALAGGRAEVTLEAFSEQVAIPVVYPLDDVRGVTTNPVHGRFAIRAALERMLAGTPLEVTRNERTGAFVVKRVRAGSASPDTSRAPEASSPTNTPSPPMKKKTMLALVTAWLAALAGLDAQGQDTRARTGDRSQSASDEVLQLTPFSVTADSDVGYVARDSLAGSRLNTPLKDTAASLSVLTKEFLDDIGATSVADAMAWSTNSQLSMQDTLSLASSGDDVNSTFYNFDQFRVRGLPATGTKNYFAWAMPTDTYNIERVEEARGPNSILFGIGSAGGVVNSMTKRANLTHDFRSGSVGISSYGGYRGTIDVNQRLGQRLALRFNGVYDRTESFRNFNYSQKQMADLALAFKVTEKTMLRAEYETGRVHENKGTNQQATDDFGNWVAAGSHLITAPIPSSQNAALGVSRMSATTRVTYIGNTDTLMNMANQYVSTGDDYALPPDVVPYEVSVGGPGVLRRPHFDNVTVSLEQQFGRNTFLEFAYNHQQYLTWNQQANTGSRLYTDVNAFLPNGQPNPYAGQHYIESEMWAWDYGLRADSTRLSLAHELDLGKWGNYRFAGMGEYDWRSPRIALRRENWVDHPYHENLENARNVVVRRQYVDPADPGSYYLKNPMAFGLIHGLTDPITGQTLSSTWVERDAASMIDAPEKQKSVLAAVQARYFKDRLVVGAGLRYDHLDTINRGATKDATGQIVTDYANNTFGEYEGKTKTFGVVYHITPTISLFYNKSNNFSLPPNIRLVPDGARASNPEGQGTDYGVSFSFFEGKLFARANYYKTDLVNGANSTYGSSTTAPGVVGSHILDALVAQGFIDAATADSHRVINTGATFAQLVEGYEFNLTANPTKNWRVQANWSYTDGYISEVAPEIQAWAAKELPYFKSFDQSIAVGNDTIAGVLDTWEDYNNSQHELVGRALPGNRKYKTNFFTSYSFSDGMLRGLRLGGGYRHYSKMPIGVYPDKTLQYGPSYWDTNAMAGYRFAHSPIPWLKHLSLQLNVSNVLNEDDAWVFRRNQATPEKIRRIRVREPRTWRLTANFDF